jgi:LmbE family N-acetylglucosaminyl deacetylase
MTPYHDLVRAITRLSQNGKHLPLGGFPPASRPQIAPDAPRVLIFAPHPDDECIIGGLPLRLMREAHMRVVNVAVTQGSNKQRQAARWKELEAACAYLGFDLVPTGPGGLERITPKNREQDPADWGKSVAAIAAILAEHAPRLILFPHDNDWNGTHIGTHYLLVDALKQQAAEFTCLVVETEFWGAMATPNLMVESTADDIADLMAATSFHVGEVQRNPYHLVQPAWMQDNVRRGGELVGGQGGAAPDFTFCTLYRYRRWKNGGFEAIYSGGRSLPANTPAGDLLSWA